MAMEHEEHEEQEAALHAALLEEEIAADELQPLLARLGEIDFGGSDQSRIRDVVELTGRSAEEVADRLAEVRGSTAEMARDKKLAELAKDAGAANCTNDGGAGSCASDAGIGTVRTDGGTM